MKISEELESVLCDALGRACVGSQGDNEIIDAALDQLYQLELDYEELKSENEGLKSKIQDLEAELREWTKYEC